MLVLRLSVACAEEILNQMFEKGQQAGVDVRGIADHDLIHSIYFRDPNGYVIELTARTDRHEELMDPALNNARQILDDWQATKQDPQS